MTARCKQIAPRWLLATLAALVMVSAGWAQESGGPVIRDSGVGYIDPAIPGNMLRFRYDTAYNNRQPSRAEFFYPRAGALGPGPPLQETSVDFQDIALDAEVLLIPSLSGFISAPVRLLNPEINDNTAGLGDLNAGLKYAFIDQPDLVTSFQLRTYAPTGDADRGLGTNHVSLEPALLLYKPFGNAWCFEGELRYWTPLGGTDFAGDIVRYGAGLHYDLPLDECWQLSPVLEMVGWTALDGRTAFSPAPGQFVSESAAGDTIVNAKLGLRVKYGDVGDLYLGYGQPLTGDQWYENTFRAELRWFF